MNPPLLSGRAGNRNHAVAIVLGTHTTKAVWLQRAGNKLRLANYVLCDTPAADKQASPDLLAEHLKQVCKVLEARTKEVILVLGMEEVLLRTVELPFYDPPRSRQVVKINGRNYVQQELGDYEVDCFMVDQARAEVTRPAAEAPRSETGDGTAMSATTDPKSQRRYRALVAAGRKETVRKLRSAAVAAGLVVRKITFTQTSLANAACLARPEVTQKEVVALVDLGFKTSTISILCNGQLFLTRVVGIGSDHITKSLAENLGVNYAAAEGVKLLMPEKVGPKLRKLIAALSQELRAAIDFFEHQEVKTVTKVLVAGGAARSPLIIENLKDELGTPCERLDATTALEMALPPLKTGDLGKEAPQLAAAIGAAVAAWMPDAMPVNLLAEEQEAEEMHRRDPVRRAWVGAALVAFGMLASAGLIWLRLYVKELELQGVQSELQGLHRVVEQVVNYSRQAGVNERTFEALNEQVANRSLWALPLNALQHVSVKDIQVVRLSLGQTVVHPPPPPARPRDEKEAAAKPQPTIERLTLTIEAKNYGESARVDRFIEAIGSQPYFKENLRELNPIVLVSRLAPQADPVDPSKTFTLFTVQCVYRDRSLGYE